MERIASCRLNSLVYRSLSADIGFSLVLCHYHYVVRQIIVVLLFSLGGGLSIVLADIFSSDSKLCKRFLGTILFAPAVDALVDASLDGCHCCGGCCCPPTYTHCCSIVHPFYCGIKACLFAVASCCPSLVLPIDDPSIGTTGYRDDEEKLSYRNSPHNMIGRMKVRGLDTLLSLMQLIQKEHWKYTNENRNSSFLLFYSNDDNMVPHISTVSFAQSRRLTELDLNKVHLISADRSSNDAILSATATTMNNSFYVRVPNSTHQILGKTVSSTVDGNIIDLVKELVLPMVVKWLNLKLEQFTSRNNIILTIEP